MWQNKVKTLLIYIFIEQEKQIKPKRTGLQIVINNFLFCFNLSLNEHTVLKELNNNTVT